MIGDAFKAKSCSNSNSHVLFIHLCVPNTPYKAINRLLIKIHRRREHYKQPLINEKCNGRRNVLPCDTNKIAIVNIYAGKTDQNQENKGGNGP